jgi:hypothetical protein
MLRTAFLLLAALPTLAADDPWDKVGKLQSGAEVRIFKKASKQPLLAKFDELTTDNLIVVVKNEQMAIARDDIDRLDARPAGGSRVKPESKVTTKVQAIRTLHGPVRLRPIQARLRLLRPD